jgi:hypothetical protein
VRPPGRGCRPVPETTPDRVRPADSQVANLIVGRLRPAGPGTGPCPGR